ncbi:DNA polymerase delta catalytic subunit [Kappamyces sp. JEL0680]|nr:DNA polymerase delta catalytic subunit [Kappamyces sp. JEL0680]
MQTGSEAHTSAARQQIDNLHQLSQLLGVGLDRQAIGHCVTLLEAGVNPEALAAVVRELKRDVLLKNPHLKNNTMKAKRVYDLLVPDFALLTQMVTALLNVDLPLVALGTLKRYVATTPAVDGKASRLLWNLVMSRVVFDHLMVAVDEIRDCIQTGFFPHSNGTPAVLTIVLANVFFNLRKANRLDAIRSILALMKTKKSQGAPNFKNMYFNARTLVELIRSFEQHFFELNDWIELSLCHRSYSETDKQVVLATYVRQGLCYPSTFEKTRLLVQELVERNLMFPKLYQIIMHHSFLSGNYALGLEIHECALQNGVLPSVTHLTILVTLLCSVDDFEGAEKVAREIIARDNGLDAGVKKWGSITVGAQDSAGTVAYSNIAYQLAKKNMPDLAWRIVEQMEEQGVPCNTTTFAGIASGYCYEGRLDKALEVLQRAASRIKFSGELPLLTRIYHTWLLLHYPDLAAKHEPVGPNAVDPAAEAARTASWTGIFSKQSPVSSLQGLCDVSFLSAICSVSAAAADPVSKPAQPKAQAEPKPVGAPAVAVPNLSHLRESFIKLMDPYSDVFKIESAMFYYHVQHGACCDRHAKAAEDLYALLPSSALYDRRLARMFSKRRDVEKLESLKRLELQKNQSAM